MFFLPLIFSLLVSISFAEVGKVSKILGTGDAYVVRNQQQMALGQDSDLEQGDEIHSRDSVLQLFIYPSIQISVSKQTQIKITKSLIEGDGEKEKSFSIINFIKGIIQLQVTKDENLEVDQKIEADGVVFGVRGTEFEVSQIGEDFDLDVIEGEVEVSSPYVQTFVPEIVKAREGFRFERRAKNFKRRKFIEKFKDHPKFARREEMREKWKARREQMKAKKIEKKNTRQNSVDERKQKRATRLQSRRK